MGRCVIRDPKTGRETHVDAGKITCSSVAAAFHFRRTDVLLDATIGDRIDAQFSLSLASGESYFDLQPGHTFNVVELGICVLQDPRTGRKERLLAPNIIKLEQKTVAVMFPGCSHDYIVNVTTGNTIIEPQLLTPYSRDNMYFSLQSGHVYNVVSRTEVISDKKHD
eukprot:GILJ01017884.1.p1 GENE.GILJ01017884.1~~GILJ01017884.1.p1  ORF type:complete len:166 (-),score=7.93 GILJ01017884.1:294-791(-)